MICLDNNTDTSQYLQVRIPDLSFPFKTFGLWRTIQLTFFLFQSVRQTLQIPKVSKSAFYFDIDRYSNFHFLATTNSISFIKTPIKNTGFENDYSTIKLFFPLNKNLDSLKIPKKTFCFFINQTHLSQKLKVLSLLSGSASKFFFVEKIWIGELEICAPCTRVLTVRTLQKVLLLLVRLHLQTCIPKELQIRIPPSDFTLKHETCR